MTSRIEDLVSEIGRPMHPDQRDALESILEAVDSHSSEEATESFLEWVEERHTGAYGYPETRRIAERANDEHGVPAESLPG